MLPLMDDKILVLKDEVQVSTSGGVIMCTVRENLRGISRSDYLSLENFMN